MAEAPWLEAPVEQASQRRAQLVAVVAHLVVNRGVAEVSHASVAKLAGCARSLVYRYFPRHEDLLYALLTTHHDVLAARISEEDEVAGVLAMKDARRGYVPQATRNLLDQLWTSDDWQQQQLELRLAGLILMRDSNLRAVLGPHDAELQDSLQRSLRTPLRGLGLTEIENAIFVDCLLSVMHHITRAALAGTMTRAEAVDLLVTVSSRVLQTFTRQAKA